MAAIHWAQAVSGSFHDPAAWAGGVAPGPADDAILDAPGSTPYTVTGESIVIRSIQTAANATLDVTGGMGNSNDPVGTGDGANAGTILIERYWVPGATISNQGLVKVAAHAGMLIYYTAPTVSAGGVISLADNFSSGIELVYVSSKFINNDNTIQGGGYIGGQNALGPVNNGFFTNGVDGVINATGVSSTFKLSPDIVRNYGLIESTRSAGMAITPNLLQNLSGSMIVEKLAGAMTIDTGARVIANAGIIAATGSGGVVVQSAISNTGRLEANGGTMTVNGAVTGAGLGVIAGGTLDFTSSFNERVQFLRPSGVLELARSQNYSGAVFGFSKTGGTSLDLRDIGFVDAAEAIFSGSASKGILTVSDGTHTARITLAGDYRSSVFIAAGDGQGGTVVATQNAPPAATSPHVFTAAMAGFAASAGEVAHFAGGAPAHEAMLIGPRAMPA